MALFLVQISLMTKILVLDDDPDLLEMVEVVLVNHQMNVSCINKGSDLFSTIDEINPQIILMDIYLGDTDGRNLCQALKKSEKYKHIPVILYSAGNISNSSIMDSLANEFISKPFDVGNLVRKIKVLVGV